MTSKVTHRNSNILLFDFNSGIKVFRITIAYYGFLYLQLVSEPGFLKLNTSYLFMSIIRLRKGVIWF